MFKDGMMIDRIGVKRGNLRSEEGGSLAERKKFVGRNLQEKRVYGAEAFLSGKSEAEEVGGPMRDLESPGRNERAEESLRTGKDHRPMWRRKWPESDAGNRGELLSWDRSRDSSFLPERQKRNSLSSWHLREGETPPPA